MKKLAIVLFNLGGPDSLAAVKPFLFNLFNDRAIISLPQPLRYLVARLVSGRRAPVAQEIYRLLGGASPILPETTAQAVALETCLNAEPVLADVQTRVFIAMRYWHPFTAEACEEIRKWGADEIVLLPLYPQYSATTTGSSFDEWAKHGSSLPASQFRVVSYATDENFVSAHAELVREQLAVFGTGEKRRLLFSAHGLPKRVIERGDPYQREIEASCAAIVERLAMPELDWAISYQSRVGPLEWIGPSTESEIERAGHQATSLVVVPVAFVSEHSETLVELDIEYAKLAADAGVPRYVRVKALGTHPVFIKGLARLVIDATGAGNKI